MTQIIGRIRLRLLAHYIGVPVASVVRYMQACIGSCWDAQNEDGRYPFRELCFGQKPTVEAFVCRFWPTLRDRFAAGMVRKVLRW